MFRNNARADDTDPDARRTGDGVAFGIFLIGLATVLNFVLDGMGPDDVAEMPWFIAIAFESGGKLGVTILLSTIGVLCIAWDVVNSPSKTGMRVAAKKRPAPPRAAPVEAPPDDADVVAE